MKKHIAVIEDDPDLLDFLELSLTSAGYRITALQQLTTFEDLMMLGADAFIIDEKLPVTSGHIICIFLKSKLQTKHLPVFLISADHRLEHIASLCEADGYLSKPFQDYRQLERLLENALAA